MFYYAFYLNSICFAGKDSVNLHSEIKCGNPPKIAVCSAIRCIDFTIHLTSLQYRAPPRPVLRQEGRETAFAVSKATGLPVSLRQVLPGCFASSVLSLDYVPAPLFINHRYDSLSQIASLLIPAVHNKVSFHTTFQSHHICYYFFP